MNNDLFFISPHQQQQYPFFSAEKSINMPLQQQDQKFTGDSTNLQLLIDWVNSFNDPYCLLVNSIADFKDGITFCHLVGAIACSIADQDKIKQLVYYDSASQADLIEQNMDLAINVLKNSNLPIPEQAQKITAQDLMSNDQMIVDFLDTLKQIHDILNFKSASRSLSPAPNSKNYQTMDQQFIQEDFTYNQMNQMGSSKDLSLNFNPQYTSTVQTSQYNIQDSNMKQGVISHNSLMTTPRGNLPLQMTNIHNQQENINANHGHRQSNIMNSGRRFEQSLEINNISPINQKLSISPINQMSKQPLTNMMDNQVMLKDHEELQLEQEISALNVSYQKSLQQIPSQHLKSQHQRSIDDRSNQSFKANAHNYKTEQSSNSKPQSTSTQREKHRLKQQQENIDYNSILRNSYSIKANQKTVDAHVFEKSLVAPQSFLIDSNVNGINNLKQQPSMLSGVQIQQQTLIDTTQKPINKGNDQSGIETNRRSEREKNIQDEEEEEVMQEMQTLNVQPESKESKDKKILLFNEIKVDPVDIRIKNKIIDWLVQEVKLLKHNEKLINQLPLYCKNGVFFFDLVNRLQGKHPILKGVDRNPKNVTSVMANLNKILEYFRAFPRFCPRYLWAQKLIMDGNLDVIWGFLDDIWYWHFNKISPFDPQNQQKKTLSPTRDTSVTIQNLQLRQQNYAQPSFDQQTHSTRQESLNINNSRMNLPPKAIMKTIDVRDRDLPRQKPDTTRVSTPNLFRPPLQDLSNNQTFSRDKSYSSLHNHNQKTPTTRDQKSKVIGHTFNYDLPLQQQAYQKRSRVVSTDTNNSFARQRTNSKSRRRDISHVNSPIAKDLTGNLYYKQDPSTVGQTIDHRETLSLLSAKNSEKIKLHEHIKISDDIENEIRNWLFNLKFASYLSKEFQHKDICNDPFSNGVLLAELFSYLEKVTLYRIISFPNTIVECKENIQKVLSVIRQRRRDFPSRLLDEQAVENILKRDRQTIYSILYHLKLSYTDVIPPEKDLVLNTTINSVTATNFTEQQIQQNLSLPYSQGELKFLETSLMNWLKSLGVFNKLYQASAVLDFQSLIEVQKDLSNGTLLAELIGTIFNVRIHGIFKDPKTENTCISNIRKALEVVRRQGKMSQKFTWTEKEVFEGKMNVIIGLLEDLHRCFDGLPPRKRGINYFSDGPYLGDTLYSVQPQVKNKLVNLQTSKETSVGDDIMKFSKVDQAISTINQSIEFGGLNSERNRFQEIPSLFSQRNNPQMINNVAEGTQNTAHQFKNTLNTLSPKSHQTMYQNVIVANSNLNDKKGAVNFGAFLNMKLQKERESSLKSPISPRLLVQPQQQPQALLLFNKQQQPDILIDTTTSSSAVNNISASNSKTPQGNQFKNHKFVHTSKPIPTNLNNMVLNKTDISSQFPIAPTRSPINVNSRGHSLEFEGRSNIKKPSQISMEDYEDEEHNQNRNQYNQKEKRKIIEWLQSLHLSIPKSFCLDIEPILHLKDGIFLCEIVGLLENQKIENVQLNPKSSASCLQNIRKALQVLKKKNQIPLYLLYSEEEIHNGNSEIIFQLLKSLRHAYKNKVKYTGNKK